MCNYLSRIECINMMRELMGYGDQKLYELYRDVKDLFADVLQNNAEFDRMVIQKRLAELANRNRKSGDNKEERLALQALHRMIQEKENEFGIDPVEFELPTIVISDDQTILDIPYEEVSDEQE